MDVFSLADVVKRRWLIVTAILMSTAVASTFVVLRVDPEYEATASVLITGPLAASATAGEGDADQVDGVAMGEGAVTPEIVSAIVSSGEVSARLIDSGVSPDYRVTVLEDGIVEVVATADDRSAAVATVDEVLAEIRRIVTSRQGDANIPPDLRAEVDVLGRPGEGVTSRTQDGGGHQAKATLLIVDDGASGASPFQDFAYVGRVLEIGMAAPEARAEVLEKNQGGADYAIERVPRDDAPLLFVTTTGPDASVVRSTLDRTIEHMGDLLAEFQRQYGIDQASWVELDVLAAPTEASLASTNLMRPLVAIIGLGVVAALSVAVLIDSWSGRQRQGLRPNATHERSEGTAISNLRDVRRSRKDENRREAAPQGAHPRRGYGMGPARHAGGLESDQRAE